MDGHNRLLEAYTKGVFSPGDIVAVAAQPKAGKSVLLLELVNNRCKDNQSILWFDLSRTLEQKHLCKQAFVARGIQKMREVISISTQMIPDIIVVDDVSKLDKIELGRMADYLKRMVSRNKPVIFLVHQVRYNINTGGTYYHNFPSQLEKMVDVKVYIERYRQTNPTLNTVILTSERNENGQNKILIPIGVDGTIREDRMIHYMAERFNLVPPKHRITYAAKTKFITENKDTLIESIKCRMHELIDTPEQETIWQNW